MEPLQKGLYITGLKRKPDIAPLEGTRIETWAQALLAWVLADPRISVAIPVTSRPERISENAYAGSGVVLDAEQRDYIRRETERCVWPRSGKTSTEGSDVWTFPLDRRRTGRWR